MSRGLDLCCPSDVPSHLSLHRWLLTTSSNPYISRTQVNALWYFIMNSSYVTALSLSCFNCLHLLSVFLRNFSCSVFPHVDLFFCLLLQQNVLFSNHSKITCLPHICYAWCLGSNQMHGVTFHAKQVNPNPASAHRNNKKLFFTMFLVFETIAGVICL